MLEKESQTSTDASTTKQPRQDSETSAQSGDTRSSTKTVVLVSSVLISLGLHVAQAKWPHLFGGGF